MADRNIITRIILTAKDETASIFSSFQAKAAAVGAAVAGYFSFDFLRGAVRSGADFEAQMSRVQAATQASAAEMATLKAAAENAGATTRFSSVQAGQALENLAKSGLDANKAIAALPGVLALAEAGDIDLAESATIVTRTVSGMGVAVGEAARIADVLAQGANASNTSVKGLADALSYAGPTAKSAGLSLEQTVTYIGKFADAGIDASRAGTALNSILSQFIDPASKFRSEMTAAGITTTNFDSALRQLIATGPKGERAILAVGQEAGPALRGLINQGVGALDDLKGKLDNAKGSAAETAATMGNNLNGAIEGLSSAWESFKIKLSEPVLGPAKAAVDDLSAAIKGAIDNGTVRRFGEAIASIFSASVEWVRKFSKELDPQAMAAKLQAGAGEIGAWFDGLAEKARNAGDIIRVAYGVMAAGTGLVMSSIFKLGEVFGAITMALLKDIAMIAEGLSKITFGAMSESFKAAAADIRISAGGAAAVAEEYGRQSAKAFETAMEGAELARQGWAGLVAPTSAAATSFKAVQTSASEASADMMYLGDAAAETAKKAESSADRQKTAAASAADKVKELRAEYNKLVEAGDSQGAALKLQEISKALSGVAEQAQAAATKVSAAQKAAADSTAESVKALRAEYDKLVEGGNSQGAALKLLEINKALQQLTNTTASAKAATDALAAAYRDMDLKTKADLDEVAARFKRNYDLIKQDGTATPAILEAAFKKYAEAAIEASGGVVSGALRGEAAMRGLAIESDGTSVSIKKIGSVAQEAGSAVSSSMISAAAAVSKMRSEAERAADRLQALKNASLGDGHGNQSAGNGSFEDLRRAGVTPEQMRNMGYTSREIEDYLNKNDQAAPGTVNRTVYSSSADSYRIGVQNGLDSDQAKVFAEMYGYFVERANAEAKSKAMGSNGTFSSEEYYNLQKKALQDALDYAKANTTPKTVERAESNVKDFFSAGKGYSVTIYINGKARKIRAADKESADEIVRALQEAAAGEG